MKHFWITLLILVVMSGLAFAAGGQEKETASAGDEAITIRIVGKDFSPTEEVNLQFLEKVEAGFKKYSGKEVNLELVQVPDGAYQEK